MFNLIVLLGIRPKQKIEKYISHISFIEGDGTYIFYRGFKLGTGYLGLNDSIHTLMQLPLSTLMINAQIISMKILE